MKKTLSLMGLFLVGASLVFSPGVGLLSAESEAAVVASVATTTTILEPVPEDPAATITETSEPEPTPPDETSTTTTAATQTLVVTGPAVSTRFGPFQVEIVVENGRLVDITTLQEPGDRRSLSINDGALPSYEAAAIDAQSADIDAISGATITWGAYTESLQAALDQAGL